jgi:hypothetical protein
MGEASERGDGNSVNAALDTTELGGVDVSLTTDFA